MREIAAPKAFVLTEEIFPVEITEDGQTIEITIETRFIKGTAETTKVDADYPDHKPVGAVLRFTPMWITTVNSMPISTSWQVK